MPRNNNNKRGGGAGGGRGRGGGRGGGGGANRKSNKFFKKNYKHGGGKMNKFKSSDGSSGKTSLIDNQKFKKFKHIRRNQESEEALRRQRQLEKEYEQKNSTNVNDDDDDDQLHGGDDVNDEEENDMARLLSTFDKNEKFNTKKLSAIESSDSSESDMEADDDGADMDDGDEDVDDEDDVDDSENDEEMNEINGTKSDINENDLKSDADEDDSESESESDDDDADYDLQDERAILRPEESKHKKNLTIDNIESDEDDETAEEDEDDEEEEEEEEEEEVVVEVENNKSNLSNVNNDLFSVHLENDLSPELFECINSKYTAKTHELNWPKLGRLQVDIPFSDKTNNNTNQNNSMGKKKLKLLDENEVYASEGDLPQKIDYKNINLNKLHIKKQIHENLTIANKKIMQDKLSEDLILTPMQTEIFSIMNNYQDIYYSNRNHQNGEEIRLTYCLHAVNHILKTRTKILHNNGKLSKNPQKLTDNDGNFRDQGLFRPKILIIVPFRDSALRVINMLIDLLFPKLGATVMHHKRFVDEFGGEGLYFPKRNPKPEDYERIFAGNSDDTFRIGISLTRKCMKLYSDFYTSDILIASPLGLRMIIGAPGDKERDYDFLASIELLILDQIDIFLAQNWDHLLHILDHMHLQPQSARNTDFSRVRTWCLNGWTRFYRQTLIFGSHELPEFRSLFNSRCSNYRGKVKTVNAVVGGSIRHVIVQIPQVFHRIDVTSIQSSFDERFNHFIKEILPQYRNSSMSHCLIYVPSYFDFVRIRNYFKKETINFVQICEYTKDEKIARARDMFFHSGAHFLLYSERAHFFRRTRIKGIRHIIMYQPPTWPHFYSEMLNFMQDANLNPRDGLDSVSMTCTILYSKYDMLQVASIVGTERAMKMTSIDKNTHMFMTDGK